MKDNVPRLRMFAGPNGSGKSTFFSILRPDLLGVYINPDQIEADIIKIGAFDFEKVGLHSAAAEALRFFRHSNLLKANNLGAAARNVRLVDGRLIFDQIAMNSYFASVLADFIRRKLLETRRSFTFETVMSHPDKISLLQKAQKAGYRTYLYYIATNDPEINVRRVANRTQLGGHCVPPDKIIERYYRSLNLLPAAIGATNRAYIFDNSADNQDAVWVAEVTDGSVLKLKNPTAPAWFSTAVLPHFPRDSPR